MNMVVRGAMMETRMTSHLDLNGFVDAFLNAKEGDHIVYATGDLAYSSPHSDDLKGLKGLVWDYYVAKKVHLTQRAREDLRFLSGRAFDYIATKRRQ